MRVKFYPAGDGMGKGTHMSIYFQLMEGPFDGLLTWPFRHTVTFMLLDQNREENAMDAFRPLHDCTSYDRPWGKPNRSVGLPCFFRLNELHTRGYLRDDTVYFQVEIDKD